MDEQEPHVLGELSKYLNGQLPGARRRRVEAHLESCESCRRHHEGLLSLRNLIQQTPSLLPPESFFQKLIPSSGVFKTIVVIGVVVLAVWFLRKHNAPQMSLSTKKTPPQSAALSEPRPVPVEAVVHPSAPPADSSVQDLQQLANTLPPPTTTSVESAVSPAAPAAPVVLPDTAPANPAPPVP